MNERLDEFYQYLTESDIDSLMEHIEDADINIDNITTRDEIIKLLMEKERNELITERDNLMREIKMQLTKNINMEHDKIMTLEDLLLLVNPTRKCVGDSLRSARWMLYLLSNTKNNNICIPEYALVKKTKLLYNGTRASILINYSNIEKSIYPNNINEIIEICSKRYIVFNLAIIKIFGNTGHANLLIIDKYFKTIERFEPHGQNSFYDEDLIDTFIVNKIITQIPDFRYIKPLDFCPVIGPQRKQEKNMFCRNEESGFCVTWVLYYFHLRLINPYIPSSTIIDYILSSNPSKLLSNIRRYQSIIEFIIPDPISDDIVDFDNSHFPDSYPF